MINARQTNNLTIYFVDKRTICVQQGGIFTYIHRWFHSQRGFYKKNFLPFRQALKYNKSVSMQYVVLNAEKYDLMVYSTTRIPDFIISKTKVNYLPSNGRDRHEKR